MNLHLISDLQQKQFKGEDGTLGLQALEPLGEGGPGTISCWEMTPCFQAKGGETQKQKTAHKGRQNSQLQDLQRQDGD